MPNLWWPVSIGFCPNREAWDRLITKTHWKRLPYPPDDGSYGTFSTFNDRKNAVMQFGVVTISDDADNGDASTATATLVHESVHAFQFVCEVIGEDRASSEFEAYGIQAIYQFMEMAYSDTRWNHGKKPKKDAPRATSRKAFS